MGLPIICLDECHIDLLSRMKRIWNLKGTKPIGFIKYSLKRMNIIGAFSNNNLIVNYVEKVNSEKIIEFLEGIKIHYKKFVLVMDNAGWHRSKDVLVYLDMSKESIFVEYLPPYSPELNPIETCWRIIRKNVLDSNLFEDLFILRDGINKFINNYEWNINMFKYLCR